MNGAEVSDEGQVWGQVEVKLEWVGGILCVWFQSGPVSIVVRDAKVGQFILL